MSDKRSVATDALETLGTIITDGGRDAIHLAVEPTVAAEKLHPGQDVGIDGTTKNPVGIVDPFLRSAVLPGEKFWLVVYPRQITSLRHVWSHPAFPSEPLAGKNSSEVWLREYAAKIPCKYEDLMYHAEDHVESGEYWVEGGRFEGEYVPEQFWDHYENVTGKKVTDNRDNFFSCSC